jgi:YD repeat-containing protein
MPHLVQMQEKLPGMAVVAVDVGPPQLRGKADQFLLASQFPFVNLGVDPADEETWGSQLNFEGIPHAYVYDREGRLVREFSGGGHYEAMEKLIAQLLQAK